MPLISQCRKFRGLHTGHMKLLLHSSSETIHEDIAGWIGTSYLTLSLKVEIPRFARNDMVIRWLVEGRSGDSQVDATKILTGVANHHFFPCDPNMQCHPERSEGSPTHITMTAIKK